MRALGLALLLAGCGAFPHARTVAPADAQAVAPADTQAVAPADTQAVAPADAQTVATDALLTMDSAAADPTSPTGRWMRRQIGNCIDVEEWLQIDLPAGFIHTVVDRNACMAHQVASAVGFVHLGAATLDLGWADTVTSHVLRFTAAVVQGYQPPLLVPDDSGYLHGTRALNRMAYLRNGDAYVRIEGEAEGTPPTAKNERQLGVDLHMAEPLEDKGSPTACSMTVSFTVELLSSNITSKGQDSFTLPCHYGPDAATGWMRITADGFEDSQTSDAWSKYFEQKGWWKSLPAPIANLWYEAFRPVLYFRPGHPEVLFHDTPQAWYGEMLSVPPTSVP